MQRVNSVTVSPPEDQTNTLYPIHISAVAQQPAPNQMDVLYVGLASLLPEHLRALCSCADLFFSRVICHSASVELEVAALARYFDDDATFERHVRRVTLSARQFVQLLEWDRRLAGMATSDVREIVEAYAAKIRSASRSEEVTSVPSVEAETLSTRPASPELERKSSRTEKDPHPISKGTCEPKPVGGSVFDADQMQYEHEAVIVPLGIIRELVPKTNATQGMAHTHLDRLMLRAALHQVRSERQAETNKHEYRALKNKERRIRRIYQLRGQVPTRKLIEITPIFGRGRTHDEIVACRVDIDVPVKAAA